MLSDGLCTHRHRSLTHAHTKNVQLKALTARLKSHMSMGCGGKEVLFKLSRNLTS